MTRIVAPSIAVLAMASWVVIDLMKSSLGTLAHKVADAANGMDQRF